jgi:hypothetical protein
LCFDILRHCTRQTSSLLSLDPFLLPKLFSVFIFSIFVLFLISFSLFSFILFPLLIVYSTAPIFHFSVSDMHPILLKNKFYHLSSSNCTALTPPPHLYLTAALPLLHLYRSLYLHLYLYLQFDYLIVFPLTEGGYTDPLYHKGGRLYGARIAWSDVASTWSKSETSDSAATSTAVTEDVAADGDDSLRRVQYIAYGP